MAKQTKRDDGGTAFPTLIGLPVGENAEGRVGMSLRDWFAGQAMPKIMKLCRNDTGANHGEPGGFAAYCAKHAYEFADAMIAERAK